MKDSNLQTLPPQGSGFASLPNRTKNKKMVQPLGFDPSSLAFQASVMTTSTKVAW